MAFGSGSGWAGSIGKSNATTPTVKVDGIINDFLREFGIDNPHVTAAAYQQAALICAANAEHTSSITMKCVCDKYTGFTDAVGAALEKKRGLKDKELVETSAEITDKFRAAVISGLGLGNSIA